MRWHGMWPDDDTRSTLNSDANTDPQNHLFCDGRLVFLFAQIAIGGSGKNDRV